MANITLSNNTVPANAVKGTLIGNFNKSVTIQTNPGQYFFVSGNGLFVAWSGTAIAGSYDIQVRAPGSKLQHFTIIVTAVVVPPPPTPTKITFTAIVTSVPDNAPAGTLLATAVVTMSDGSRFAGTLTTSDASFFGISGLNIVTARGLTPADVGQHTTTITAHQGGASLSERLSL